MARTPHGFGRKNTARSAALHRSDPADQMMATRVLPNGYVRAPRRLRQRLAYAVGPTLILAMGATVMASAQSNSPFANQKKVQAWELPNAGTAPQTTSAPATGAPVLRGLRTTQPVTGNRAATTRPSAPVSSAPSQAVRAPAQTVQRQTTQTQSRQSITTQSPSQTAQTQTAQAQSGAATQSRSQATVSAVAPSIPSSNYTYRAPTSTSRWTATTQSHGQPQTQGRMGVQTQGQVGGQYGASGLTGGYAPRAQTNYNQVPRGSVSAAPRHSVNNPDADWTVHELPPQPGSYRAQAGARGPAPSAYAGYEGRGTYEGGPYAPNQGQYGQTQSGPAQSGWGQPAAYDPYAAPQGGYGQPAPAPRRGFFDRIGLGTVSALIRGGLRAGAAARESNDWEEAFIADADLEVEISAITQTGLEWGVHTQVRGQYDEGRKGFARRLPDCPPTLAGCPSLVIPGSPTPASVRGHTSQHYVWGPDVAKDTQFAVESAHLFLRSAYGDITLGRDDGAAFLFSLGAPTLMNVGASNSPVDYTGLDAVKTINEASGFSEKVTYTSPRLLGDQVGVGVQLGVSYSPRSNACGVDYCVDLNDIQDVVTPDIKDVFEAGLALDRTFAPGMSVEGTLTYAHGSEQTGLAGLDDLQAFGAGLEFRMNQWTLGGSWLNSNQGLENGDYEAFDVGLTWQPTRLGFTLGYGRATDDLIGLTSDQIMGGVSYDVSERLRLGAGVQYADRESLRNVAGTAQVAGENATAIFIEGGITF